MFQTYNIFTEVCHSLQKQAAWNRPSNTIQPTNIQHPTTNQHPTLYNQPTSNIKHHTSNIQHLTYIQHPTSENEHPTQNNTTTFRTPQQHPTPKISKSQNPTTDIQPLTSNTLQYEEPKTPLVITFNTFKLLELFYI